MFRKLLTTLLTLVILAGIVASSAVSTPVQASHNNNQTVNTARNGAWVDSVTFTAQSDYASAITQLQSDQLDIYASGGMDSTVFQTVKADPNLAYTTSSGNWNELTFNPSGPEFNDGRLNPFSNPKIREAMNMLVDRGYISHEIFGDLAKPKYTSLQTVDGDYARYLDTVHDLEAQYAYNFDQAKDTISNEMLAMGAELSGDGIWQYNGSPVTLIFIIRLEDQRLNIGDYVADQLESIGFTVDRQYKTRSEASPIWNQSDPAEGLWHLYTGGWVSTAISRDDATNFGFFYTSRGSASPLWQAYTPSAEFDAVAEKLWGNDFSSMAERDQLFETALELSMQDSVRVWLIEGAPFWPRQADTTVANDLATGLITQVWPYTVRFNGQEGGNMRIAQPGVLMEPWNPVAGSSYIYDWMPIYATQDFGIIPDPETGLPWPQRIERAEVVARDGLPIQNTHDWVNLTFTPTITVPADAWVDWDASSQRFITAAEKYTQTVTANIKSTVYYPADLFDTVEWHDGSPLDMGDFLMRMILTFDRGKVESDIYDESYAPTLDAFLSHFKGVRIVSEDPLVIETYDDGYQIDAELNIIPWWPNYNYGQSAWHNLALGVHAEADQVLAFSSDKASLLGVEWMSFIAGPSLSILQGYLDDSVIENSIPYSPTLSLYVTPAEATARWANLSAWYNAKGHFWLGTGPFYLESADTTQGIVTLTRFADFPDPADKWDYFVQAPTLDINYATGAPGSSLNLMGDNFPPNQTATISINGQSLGTILTSDSGIFTLTLTTSNADEGVYYATAAVNPSATVKFVLDDTSAIRPPEGSYPTFDLPSGLAYIYKSYLALVSK